MSITENIGEGILGTRIAKRYLNTRILCQKAFYFFSSFAYLKMLTFAPDSLIHISIMTTITNLTRFLDAQTEHYGTAFKEIRAGRKATHWMWFIFPQIKGLGFSDTARFYAINDKQEASAFLGHETLGTNLIEISNELLKLHTTDAIRIFGTIDSLKLRSSMTLFAVLENTHPVFQRVLDKFFEGSHDMKTIELLNKNL